MRSSWLVAMLGCVGCAAQTEYFRPTEKTEGETTQGYQQAVYDMVGPEGRFGEAKVWSRGAYLARERGENRTVVHVAFELENSGGAPLEVDLPGLRLESVQANQAVFADLGVAHVSGETTVAPGALGRLEAFFVLPAHVQPQHVDAFRVRWTVRAGQQVYSQFTPFAEDEARYAYVPVYAYYYPYYPFHYPYYSPYRMPLRHRVVIVRPPHRHVMIRPHGHRY